ncbi:sensor histidine kinase [Tenacibaculum xiamenense]|uniref:sensor histidine kinase n=1 Tax=Tenacibaculum xiamenense TaxID=1261553 RepID=UPI0038B49C4A
MGNKATAWKMVKSISYGIFAFLMITLSLFHIFFENTSKEQRRIVLKYKNKVKERDKFQVDMLDEFDKGNLSKAKYIDETKKGFLHYKEELIKIIDKKKQLTKEHTFRGRNSFHFWLYVTGIVTLGLFFSVKSLIDDVKRKNPFKQQFLSFTGVIVCIFWLIHHTFLTQKDFSKQNYVGLLILCSLISTAFIFYLIKYTLRKKTYTKKDLLKAEQTINHLEESLLLKQEQERAKERQRISEELHDGVLGKLFGTRMGLGFLDISTTEKEKYEKFLFELQEIEKEIRNVSHKLSANLTGADINFESLVRDLMEEKSQIGKFDYKLNFENMDWRTVNDVIKLNLYRVIQESIQNILKHAKATEVIINLKNIQNVISVEIHDNGIGFSKTKQKSGIGLKNIHSRIKKVKGTISINTEHGKGTSIILNIPLKHISSTSN